MRELQDAVVKDKETALFECEVSLPNVPIKWLVKGQEVQSSPKYIISMDKTVHTLRVEKARKLDQGQVKAVFYQLESKASLTVTGMDYYIALTLLLTSFRTTDTLSISTCLVKYFAASSALTFRYKSAYLSFLSYIFNYFIPYSYTLEVTYFLYRSRLIIT